VTALAALLPPSHDPGGSAPGRSCAQTRAEARRYADAETGPARSVGPGPFRRCAPDADHSGSAQPVRRQHTNFDANQKALAGKVSSYLSSLVNVSGNFVQVGPDGKRSTGDFYIQKPGKIRFEYDDPSPIALVADGSSVIVRDRRLATQDVYPLSQTPLRFLLADRIDLLRDTNVVGIGSDDMFISVTIEEKQPLVGTSRLMLMIGAKDNQLKQWTVTDPQGYDTTVAVYNLDTTKKLDPGMFKIDYTNYNTNQNWPALVHIGTATLEQADKTG
jgi:outer membrane lipoprotein-sorting protein